MAGCSTSSPASVAGLRQTIGNELPGAQGKTRKDQNKIDDTVARACAAEVFTRDECAKHTKAAGTRIGELAKTVGQ